MRQIDVIKIYNQKKCLIIDDFPEVRGSVKRILKNFGVNSIDTAANGDEAVALCKSHRYDIVLCDYNLGAGKDGQQVLEELRYLRALLNTSLFVLITAESSRQMVLGALECEPDDYITKPITQTSLRVRLDKALLKHEALYDIKKAIDKRDYQSAITQCDRVMKAQKKYVTDCLKLKAQLYLKIEQYPQAKKIYEDVLAIKPVHWARLGLGKTLLAMNDLERAEALLKAVLKDDNRYVE
ncbi:MAG: response regulator, partial [Exilibacterium sp.]